MKCVRTRHPIARRSHPRNQEAQALFRIATGLIRVIAPDARRAVASAIAGRQNKTARYTAGSVADVSERKGVTNLPATIALNDPTIVPAATTTPMSPESRRIVAAFVPPRIDSRRPDGPEPTSPATTPPERPLTGYGRAMTIPNRRLLTPNEN